MGKDKISADELSALEELEEEELPPQWQSGEQLAEGMIRMLQDIEFRTLALREALAEEQKNGE